MASIQITGLAVGWNHTNVTRSLRGSLGVMGVMGVMGVGVGYLFGLFQKSSRTTPVGTKKFSVYHGGMDIRNSLLEFQQEYIIIFLIHQIVACFSLTSFVFDPF